jgi:hypothetical protein
LLLQSGNSKCQLLIIKGQLYTLHSAISTLTQSAIKSHSAISNQHRDIPITFSNQITKKSTKFIITYTLQQGTETFQISNHIQHSTPLVLDKNHIQHEPLSTEAQSNTWKAAIWISTSLEYLTAWRKGGCTAAGESA